jgi:hypothetical protein
MPLWKLAAAAEGFTARASNAAAMIIRVFIGRSSGHHSGN